ncbi:hypothetical protein G5B88_12000 [Herbaspirillum seropedicae]|uniref:Uncharacterized protein n=1 Tax=Herbaspirillum seropedicae (strain SmR1) TaxID=757424 RepID=D8IVD1_HERSS|nr:hypothetical protein [Herbaspirillum seropedicae]ADJ63870.1 hypothetical protein Hsero_2371 [Herbaspirillum seropedicae SmR1]AKN65864.1 hypothetical protein ACP92_11845 [Herbaspirillum seropedicae]NQE29015.1 hypothetical protein [Herbaspirillum seropedicae]UMU21841.1 hypothetical protein G5B88_12000 [Herbaspirillum seropedicae]
MDKTGLIVAGALLVGAVGVAYYAKKKIGNMIPPVVQEGVEAAGLIGSNFGNMITNPLEAFGIRKPVNNMWIYTTPWENTDDVVSNNSSGINFNYF